MLCYFHLFLLQLFVITTQNKGNITWYPTKMDVSDIQFPQSNIGSHVPAAARYEDFQTTTAFNGSLIAYANDNSVKDKVHFYHYTRQNQYKPQELKPGQASSLLKENIKKPVKLVVHGFWHSSRNRMSVDLRKKLLEFLDGNVIVVDWRDITRKFWYNKVVNTTLYVGRYLALLLDWLIKEGVDPSNIHLIGHSLGAHVSGYAGALVKEGKIGRISGLDPALPGFINVDVNRRLDPSDAQFVDCIHTSGGVLGFMEPIGHADFYPNGGRNLQPGCLIFDFIGVCGHLRATKYFTESVDPNYRFPAAQCPKIPTKEPVDCFWSEHFMGYHLSQRARGIFYVETCDRPPFSIRKTFEPKNIISRTSKKKK